jgi:hypothetical protein
VVSLHRAQGDPLPRDPILPEIRYASRRAR